MSWAHSQLDDGREIGYGVPDVCNAEGCTKKIDRGLAYVCGGMHEGGDWGCGKYICDDHANAGLVPGGEVVRLCDACCTKWEHWLERQAELQTKLIYAIVVAGKSARFANEVMEGLRAEVNSDDGELLFEFLHRQCEAGKLRETLEQHRTGNYTKLEKAIRGLLEESFDLEEVAPEDLERIHGIGPKTARFFIVWTRPAERYAVLDVHVLRWMREHGHDVPRSTPGTPQLYRRIEGWFLEEAARRKMTPRQLDLEIWGNAARFPNVV
jgi:thermostable 8-oxoguanine DNA glycosylase